MTDRRLSIRRTLLRQLGSLFLGSMLVLFAGAYGYGRNEANASYDRLLRASALAIAENVARVGGRLAVDLPYTALDQLSMAPDDRVFYRVWEMDGHTIVGDRALPEPVQAAGSIEPAPFDARYGGEAVRFVVLDRAIAYAGGSDWVRVQVGQTRRARNALAADMLWRATLPIASVTLAALLLVWLGVRRALQPVLRIEQDLAAREPSDLQPIAGAVPVELTQLIGSLNRFMTRVSSYTRALERLINLAGHQLRTPAAAILLQAQEALDCGEPSQQRRSLAAIERNAAQVCRLLEQLRSHAKVAHLAELRLFEAVDLVVTARQAADAILPRAAPTPELRFGSFGETWVLGDAFMLAEAVKNLVDNALRYGCPERGPLELEVRANGDRCVLSLLDHGPGIPADDLERVLRPYERGHNTDCGGDGLGLAIVSEVAKSHGGQLRLSNREGGGLAARIELPRLVR